MTRCGTGEETKEFATKADIAKLRSELRSDLNDLKSEMMKMLMVHGITVIGLTVGLIELLA